MCNKYNKPNIEEWCQQCRGVMTVSKVTVSEMTVGKTVFRNVLVHLTIFRIRSHLVKGL
ncbi:hypothetical protein C1645_828050 [Glomus cerebriforme]|uniref:Uncharacterized protein n=1 Tax=Glomus cerebriforme TaxID=658196 RepID=A0A397SNI3_9GLOM|nr:hypothetical protein C1645_828050 [Glomus cerebriforme]